MLVILVMAMVQAFCQTLHYFEKCGRGTTVTISDVNVHFVLEYLKTATFAFIIYYYSDIVARIFQQEGAYRRYATPCIVMAFVVLTTVLAVALSGLGNGSLGAESFPADHDDERFSCKHPVWLVLSVFNFVLSLAFFVLGYAMTVKMQKTTMPDDLRTRKTNQVWTLIVVFFVTCVVGLSFDIVSQASASCQVAGLDNAVLMTCE
jgi:predicted PurR-regulated permease PerM